MNIVLDLETTSLVTESDENKTLAKICEVAFTHRQGKYSKVMSELINPEEPITTGAMAIHHITDRMVEDRQSFKQSDSFRLLSSLNKETNNLIGHNIIKFDEVVLRNNGFNNKMNLIDTLILIQHVESDLLSYKQSELIYILDLYKTKKYRDRYGTTKSPQLHRAEEDIFITGLLLDYIKNKVRAKGFKGRALTDKLIQLSKKVPIIQRMPFGKYKGERFKEIIKTDWGYVEWMFNTLEPEILIPLRYWMKH